jgi:hypothetical protein
MSTRYGTMKTLKHMYVAARQDPAHRSLRSVPGVRDIRPAARYRRPEAAARRIQTAGEALPKGSQLLAHNHAALTSADCAPRVASKLDCPLPSMACIRKLRAFFSFLVTPPGTVQCNFDTCGICLAQASMCRNVYLPPPAGCPGWHYTVYLTALQQESATEI